MKTIAELFETRSRITPAFPFDFLIIQHFSAFNARCSTVERKLMAGYGRRYNFTGKN